MRKKIISMFFFGLCFFVVKAQEKPIDDYEVNKLLLGFKKDYLNLVNILSNQNIDASNINLVNEQIQNIILSYFTSDDSRIYNFHSFETNGNLKSFSKIKDFLDYSSHRIEKVNALEFYSIEKHPYYNSHCNLLFSCFFKIKVKLFDNNDVNYLESGRLLILLNENLKISGIYNENDRNNLPSTFFKDTDCNGINDQFEDIDRDGIVDQDDECPKIAGIAKFKGCPDSDDDGIPDKKDLCPYESGIAKFRGCPDTDEDGIQDSIDSCPNQKGIAKFRGCPDSDNDGIPDKKDSCPYQSGITEFTGCPDSDGDGIQDKEDSCPFKKGIPKLNGCPDSDNDGIKDSQDSCPYEAGPVELRGCPDFDKDGVPDKEDKCKRRPGSKINNGCPDKETKHLSKPFNIYVNAGIGMIFHPSAKVETKIFGFERNISSFDSGIGESPFEGGLSLEYLFDRNGNTKQGFKFSLAYNSYPFRYIDTSEPPSDDPDLLTNKIFTPQFISSSLSYRIGFFPMKLKERMTHNNFLVFNFGISMKSQILKEATDDFIVETPIYTFIHTRVHIFYMNLGYPLHKINNGNSFINEKVLNDNSKFIPYIFSFGIEIPMI